MKDGWWYARGRMSGNPGAPWHTIKTLSIDSDEVPTFCGAHAFTVRRELPPHGKPCEACKKARGDR